MNIYDTQSPSTGETLTTLLAHKNIKINHILSSDDFEATEYNQEEDEWLVLLEGKATLLIDKVVKILKNGDTLFIPANVPHTILSIEKGTAWLTVHID